MKAAIVRWTFYLLALFLIGPLAGGLIGGLRGADGSPEVTPLLSTVPALGLMLALSGVIIAAAVGIFAAMLVGAAAGLITAGVIVAWVAFRSATVDELIRSAQSDRPLTLLAVEGLVFGLAAIAMVLFVGAAGKRHDVEATDGADVVALNRSAAASGGGVFVVLVAQSLRLLFKGRGGLMAIPVAVIAGALAAAFIAGSPMKGQALAAAIVGGIAVGAASRLVDNDSRFPAMFIGIAILAIVGPLIALGLSGNAVVQATYRGTLFPLAWITPLDWIAGGLLGIPMGVSWAGSMTEKKPAA